MNPRTNPFVPGAGSPPRELAGRDEILEKADIALERVRNRLPAQSLILVGLRGVGKTVLLVRFRDIAEEKGYYASMVEAHEGKRLVELLVPPLRKILLSLDQFAAVGEKARKGLGVLRSFMSAFKLSWNDLELGISPELGSADSGDLESDLADLFVAVGEAAVERNTAVALCIDELQYLNEKEFSSLIMAVHKVSQLNLPLIVVGAGLPQILALAGSSKSYAERLFEYPKVGALQKVDAEDALVAPVKPQGVEFSQEALDEILRVTQGYPYFLQQWGHESWNLAQASPIEKTVVETATVLAVKKLDTSFFQVRFDRCTPAEKRYLRALADLGPGPHKSGEIADRLGLAVTSVGPTRSKLIAKGMIYSPQFGETSFTVPLFDEYMRRVMADEAWKH